MAEFHGPASMPDPIYAHRFLPGTDTIGAPLVLLHGSGGNECDLMPLASELAPGAARLGIRGMVAMEGGYAFFHRFPDRRVDEAEPGFAILVIGLSLQRRTCSYDSATLASISLHAVARWHQRTWNTSHVALAADVSTLAAAIGGIDLTSDSKFSIPAASGRWAGTVYEILDDEHLTPVLAVRTFLTD